ncbi:MAG: hypothetical protein ACR9NN_21930 [Nostochopsis sp.]
MPVRYAQHPVITCLPRAEFIRYEVNQGFHLTRSVSSRRWLFLLAANILAFLKAVKTARVVFPPVAQATGRILTPGYLREHFSLTIHNEREDSP